MVRMAVGGSPLPSPTPPPPALVVTGRQGHFELMNGLYGLAAERSNPKADPSGSRQFVQVFYTKEGPSECGKRDGSDLVLVCQYEKVSSALRSPPGLGPDGDEEKPRQNGEVDECSYKEWTGCVIGWRQQPNGKPIDQNLKKTFWSERPWWQEFFVCARGGLSPLDDKDAAAIAGEAAAGSGVVKDQQASKSLAGRLFEVRLGWEVRDEEGEFRQDGSLRLAAPGAAVAAGTAAGRVTLRLAEDASLTGGGGGAGTTPKTSEQFNPEQNPVFHPAMMHAMMAAGMMPPGDGGMNSPMAFRPPGGYPPLAGMPSEMMGPHGMMFPPFDPATFGMPPTLGKAKAAASKKSPSSQGSSSSSALPSSSAGLVEAPVPPKWEPYLGGAAGRSAGCGDKGSLSANAPCFVPMANVDENKEMR